MERNHERDPALLIGIDIRPLARNALRHGHDITVIDRYPSEYLSSKTTVKTLQSGVTLGASIRALSAKARTEKVSRVVFGPGFENDVLTLSRLSEVGLISGCSLETVRKVRDPESLSKASQSWSFLYPEICYKPTEIDDKTEWVSKPFASFGGVGVKLIESPQYIEYGASYFQRYVKGFTSSAIVVSDGSEAFVLGTTAQIAGDPAFGASNFEYCGSIYPNPFHDEIIGHVMNIADGLTLEFDIRGLWGFDFVYHGDDITLLEVNPRPTLAIDALDLGTFNDLLGMHLDSVSNKSSDLIIDPGALGKYYGVARPKAQEDTMVGNPIFDENLGALDIPSENEFIAKGDTIAVIAEESGSYSGVVEKLRNSAKLLYESFRSEASPLPR